MEKKIKIIYILGHSRSGSTVLGFKIGSLDRCFFAGEIKKYGQRIFNRICTCGRGPFDCIYWSELIKANKKYFNSSKINDGIFRKTMSNLFFLSLRPSKKIIQEEEQLLESMYKIMKDKIDDYDYIVDSSKSLNRFMVLKEIQNVEVYPIYLQRNLRDNLASFVKRKQGLLINILRIRLNDRLIKLYLKSRSIDYLNIDYESFTNDPQAILQKVSSFVNHSGVCKEEGLLYHAITGSKRTRNAFQANPFAEVSNRNIDNPFSPFQKKILKVLRIH